MVTEISCASHTQHILTAEHRDTDFSRLIGVCTPMLAIQAYHDDMVGELFRNRGNVCDTLSSDTVHPYFQVGGFVEAALKRDDRGISWTWYNLCGWRSDVRHGCVFRVSGHGMYNGFVESRCAMRLTVS
jgi:hypothetical protein